MKYRGIFLGFSPEAVKFTREYCLSILCELSKSADDANYEPFHEATGKCLERFFGPSVDLQSTWKALWEKDRDVLPYMFKVLFRDQAGTLYFVDVNRGEPVLEGDEEKPPRPRFKPRVELDVFSKDETNIDTSLDRFLEALFKHFGIESSRDDVVYAREDVAKPMFEELKKNLVQCFDPAMQGIYRRIEDAKERELLFEVKRSKSLFARDIPTLKVGGLDPGRISKLLDYYSGAEMRLLEKRYGIQCKSSGDLICVLESKADLEKAKDLECPRCKKKLQFEEIESIYRPTETLKDLLDHSRWMPLQVKDLMENCGVPEDNILISATHDTDEFDVVALVCDTLLVFELKDREVSLGDAYKFSAKFSRLDRLMGRLIKKPRGVFLRFERSYGIVRDRHRDSRGIPGEIAPVIITTRFIEKDAVDFLDDMMGDLKVFEHSDKTIETGLNDFIRSIQNQHAFERLRSCCSVAKEDSIANLAGALTECALLTSLNKDLESTDNSRPSTTDEV